LLYNVVYNKVQGTGNRFFYSGMILLLFIVNILFSTYFIEDAYPSHNTVSNIVMASAPIHGIGLPYKDYWDIYPPGIYLFLTPFEFFFQSQTVVFKIVHIIFSCIIGLVVLKFLTRIFKNYILQKMAIAAFFLLYLLLSNYYYCILFHNAFLALFLSVCGFYLLAFSENKWTKYFLSSILLAFSASIKETFLFIPFLPLFYLGARYLWRESRSYIPFFKYIGFCVGGIAVIFIVNYLYLHLLGVSDSYREVSKYKAQLIQSSSLADLFNNLNPFNFYDFDLRFKDLFDSFFKHSYGLIYSLCLCFFLFLLISVKPQKDNGKWKFIREKWDNNKGIYIIILGFCLLHFEGFQLLKKYQPNYTLQMIPALILVFALFFQITNRMLNAFLLKKSIFGFKSYLLTGCLAFCFIWLLLPKLSNFNFMRRVSFHEYISGLVLEKPVVQFPEKVKKAMGNDHRIFYIYGWGTPYFYDFAKVRPFSKYFILHPSILGDAQVNELVMQFKKELPKVVLYNESGADMDIMEFEKNTVCFKKMLEKCYEFYPSKIYPGFNCTGYYILKDSTYFKSHLNEFIASTYF
jgi:hypothetical protein